MNISKIDLLKIDTIILVGGLGTRLSSIIKNKPKCLIPINGKPFIDILLDECIKQGLERFILCVGYLKEQVISHLKNRDDCEIIFSQESNLLGTGGAIKNAEKLISSNNFIVINGDTLLEIDFLDWLNNLTDLESIALCKSNKSGVYGSISIDKDGKLSSFIEKHLSPPKNAFVNTGRYIFTLYLHMLFF